MKNESTQDNYLHDKGGSWALNAKPQIAQCPIRGLPCNPQCLNITSDLTLSIYHCIASLHISVVVWASFLDMHLEPYYIIAVASASGQFVHSKVWHVASEDLQWHQKFNPCCNIIYTRGLTMKSVRKSYEEC